jgi:cell shape-determining protein MreC
MKRMFIFLFALVLGASMLSFAQSSTADQQTTGSDSSGMHHGDHDRMAMDPQAIVGQLDQQLTLTSDQKSKITTILENSEKHAQELRSNNSGDKNANHQAMRQLHENTQAQIRATLTADQQTKFEAMMKEHENMRAKHHSDSDSSGSTNSTTDNPK